MAMTFKMRRDGREKAAFAVYFTLTREEVAKVVSLAEKEQKSCRQWLNEVAIDAIEKKAGLTID